MAKNPTDAMRRAGRAIRDRRIARARGQKPKRPRTTRCQWCARQFPVKPRGREPEYCSHACRQRSYESRPRTAEQMFREPRRLLGQNLEEIHVRDAIRQEIWDMLREAGLLPTKSEPPLRQHKESRRKRGHLKLAYSETQGSGETTDPSDPDTPPEG